MCASPSASARSVLLRCAFSAHVLGLQAHRRQTELDQLWMQPRRQRAGLVPDTPQAPQIRLERAPDRLRIGHHRRLQHHLAFVVHHANCGFVHPNIQSGQEFHRSPPALLNATSLRIRHLASHPSASPNSQPRPITGGNRSVGYVCIGW
jgi:hypothetical protein